MEHIYGRRLEHFLPAVEAGSILVAAIEQERKRVRLATAARDR